MRSSEVGLLLVGLGVFVALAGFLVMVGGLGWFGRLPGDFSWTSGGGRARVYAPLASMLVVSLVLTVLLNLLGRFFR